MDEKQKQKMIKLLKVFKIAVEEERKTKVLYKKMQKVVSVDKECSILFEWLANEEVRHEEKLREKYKFLKKEYEID
ncbi:MAG: hypothetical protein A2252_09785 [Elusimicrobia bacterium RIFOXYA2_FULL_39_19]|nr:MAG: hypothetical protein A2252_09785 [Elusimicrobia bacterium RIFOXYA2_FULL_39_19]